MDLNEFPIGYADVYEFPGTYLTGQCARFSNKVTSILKTSAIVSQEIWDPEKVHGIQRGLAES